MHELTPEYLRHLRIKTEANFLIWQRQYQDDHTECILEKPSTLGGTGVVIKRYRGKTEALVEMATDFSSVLITPEVSTDDWSITFSPKEGRSTTYTTNPEVLTGDTHLDGSDFSGSFRELEYAIWPQNVEGAANTKITIESIVARTKDMLQ